MTLMSAPPSMICAQGIATNIALTRLDLMSASVVKDMKRSLEIRLLIDRTIALILTNVHLQPTIVILTQLARTKNHCGRVDVMMDIMVTVITAPKLTTVSRIHVHSIRNASGQGSKDYLILSLVHQLQLSGPMIPKKVLLRITHAFVIMVMRELYQHLVVEKEQPVDLLFRL